jgi:50S ribosomal subunit-associated GTPase HflX
MNMKSQGILVGKKGAGKTLFCIQFAKFLGLRELDWLVERADGTTELKRMSLKNVASGISGWEQRTDLLQTVSFQLRRGTRRLQLVLTDTAGLCDGIPNDPEVRCAIAKTLSAMVSTETLFHIVDVQNFAYVQENVKESTKEGLKECPNAIQSLDRALATFGSTRKDYILLANKMDLPGAKKGFHMLKRAFPKQRVIPISALTGMGFREVKHYVRQLA